MKPAAVDPRTGSAIRDLRPELFGPAATFARYAGATDLAAALRSLDGRLAERVGRVVVDGLPTLHDADPEGIWRRVDGGFTRASTEASMG